MALSPQDRRLGVVTEFDHEWRDAPQQIQLVAHPLTVRKRKDRPGPGPEQRSELSHVAVPGEDENAFRLEFVGHDHGGADNLLAFVLQFGMLGVAGAAAALDALGDSVQHLDAFERVFSDGGFAGEHDRVGLLEYGIGDVGHLGAGRHRVLDHRLQHVRGDDDRLAVPDAGLDGSALDDRQFFVGTFDTEITTGNHDAVAGIDEVVKVLNGLLVFNLGDDFNLSVERLQNVAQFLDVFTFTDK